MFEQGALKEQKLKKQQITAAPEFKQHLLQPLHHLKPDFQVNILTKITCLEVSLKELKTSCTAFRSSEAVKASFVRLTNTGSWREAQQKYQRVQQWQNYRSLHISTFDIQPQMHLKPTAKV